VAELEARLRALEDREAIRDLIARYGPLADSGDAVGVAALWREDGVYAIAGFAEAKGRAAIAALIESDNHRQLMQDGCAHVLSPPMIDLSGDQAMARNHSLVLRWTDTAFEVHRVAANRWQLSRGPDGWKVIRRDNALLQGGEAARALLSLPAAPHQS
jgi:ketosteroid isomerase-like protein